MRDINTLLAGILEVEKVYDEDGLDTFEAWDSLAVLSLMFMVDEEYGVIIGNDEIKSAKTIGDLKSIIREKLGG